MLEEMDSEFGIAGLIEEEFGSAKKQVWCSVSLSVRYDEVGDCI